MSLFHLMALALLGRGGPMTLDEIVARLAAAARRWQTSNAPRVAKLQMVLAARQQRYDETRRSERSTGSARHGGTASFSHPVRGSADLVYYDCSGPDRPTGWRRVARLVVTAPEQALVVRPGRKVRQSRVTLPDGACRLVRVVVDLAEGDMTVVTVYRTSKVAKYWRAL